MGWGVGVEGRGVGKKVVWGGGGRGREGERETKK